MEGSPPARLEVARDGLRAHLRVLVRPGSGLSQRVAYAGFWALALRGTLHGFSTGRTVVLARLLAPGDFGLMGLALLVLGLLETFTQTGFRAALIQRQGDIRPYLDTAWTVEALRGLALAGALVLAAPLVASFFAAPEAVPIVRVMAVVALLGGLRNIGVVAFDRELEFRKRFLYQMVRAVAEVGVGIGMALALRSAWALVYGALAGVAAEVAASYLLHPYRPRPRLAWGRVGELYRFGRWVLLSNGLFFLASRGDSAAIGKVLGPVALGVYEMGRRIAELTTREVSTVVSAVTFPAYARVQDDVVRLRRAYFLTVEAVSCVTFPVAAVLLVLAGPLTRVVLGESWLAVASVLPALVAAGSVRALAATGGALYAGTGQPRLDFQMSLVRTALMLALILPLMRLLGVAGAALAVLVGALTTLPFYVGYSTRVLRVTPLHLGRALLPATALSGAAALGALLGRVGPAHPGVAELLVAVGLAGGGYALAALLLWRVLGAGPVRVLTLGRPRSRA